MSTPNGWGGARRALRGTRLRRSPRAAGQAVGRSEDGPNPARPVPSSDVRPSGCATSRPQPLERWRTGLNEFDFVLGGGIVPGSMTLIGGEPGIGKSTLLLQAAARLENAGHRVLYTSGEESPDQIRLRADRLINEDAGPVHVLGETRLESIIQAVGTVGADVVVIDSIQTVYTDQLESAPGNVGQVRECSGQLMRFAKESGTSVIVVGHVTKGGGIAGPKTLEHIVDTVLYFEGEATLDYRLLRTTKNRFGSVDELGVFSMTETGLVAVPNPSAVFLAARAGGTSGSAVTALMEGTRPVLVEVQALAAKSGTAHRSEWLPGWIRAGWRYSSRYSSAEPPPRLPISMCSFRSQQVCGSTSRALISP